jgi:hypothetical protein
MTQVVVGSYLVSYVQSHPQDVVGSDKVTNVDD